VHNGEVSYWWQARGGVPPRRPSLPGSTEADVCIVGAGYTGLWTAYYLKRADPGLRIVVLEANFAGFGASGRNGGWVTATLPGSRARYARRSQGVAGVRELERHLRETIDEVARVCDAEGIDAGLVKGGTLTVATSAAQDARLRQQLDTERSWGDGDDIVRYLDQAELAGRLRVAGAAGALYSPHCARIQPADLAAGLAEVVSRAGVLLYESTPVTSLSAGIARTPAGQVRAPVILRCTEGFTADIPGQHRTLLPMNSSMIATGPLSDEAWKSIGWDGLETLGDEAHAYIYAQRTRDGRIAAPPTASARAPTTTARSRRRRSPSSAGSCAGCSRWPPKPGSTTPGAGCSGCRGTGAPPSAWIRGPAWAGRAAIPGTGSRPLTWPAARSPTWPAVSPAR